MTAAHAFGSVALAWLVAAPPGPTVPHVDQSRAPVVAKKVFTVQDPRLVEISGMSAGSAEGVLFVHEDAGRPAVVYALDDAGRVRMALEVPGVEALDWEDMARGTDDQGRPALYVADIGDAFATLRDTGAPARTAFSLVRFTEPEVDLGERVGILPAAGVAADVVSFPLRFEDGRDRNAEALAVQPGSNRVFVVDKVGDGGRRAYLWVAPETLDPAGPNDLVRSTELPVTGASGAAFSAAGDLLAVRDETTAYLWRVEGDVAAALTEPPVEVALPQQRQGESITFAPDGRSLLLGSEGKEQPVWSVELPDGVSGTPAADATGAPAPGVEGSGMTEAFGAGAPWVIGATTAFAVAAALWLRARRRRAGRRVA